MIPTSSTLDLSHLLSLTYRAVPLLANLVMTDFFIVYLYWSPRCAYWKRIDVALWFQALWDTLQGATLKDIAKSKLPWLQTIVEIATGLIQPQGDDLETFKLLVNYGRRRGGQSLSLPVESGRPFFDLRNPYTLATVEANIDDGIHHMRETATSLDLKDYEAFIIYSETCVDGVYCKLGTAIPHTRLSSKRWQDGSFKQEHMHAGWIVSK